MKLANKYLITLGAISATAAGAIGYGAYSAVKFNEKFQGVGWYVGTTRYDTKAEAVSQFKISLSSNKEYYKLNFGFVSKPRTGIIGVSTPGSTTGEVLTLTFDNAATNNLKILSTSDIGVEIKKLKKGNKTNKEIIEELLKNSLAKHMEYHLEQSDLGFSKVVLTFGGSDIIVDSSWEIKSNKLETSKFNGIDKGLVLVWMESILSPSVSSTIPMNEGDVRGPIKKGELIHAV